jgi:small nuclear ribonucleoprotein G
MNIVLDEAFEEKAGGEKVAIGMIVRISPYILTCTAVED